MATNFQFLKKINSNLFEIITEAEKLYRDEYFEQCMVQTRRFGEQVCKDILEQNNKDTGSFDEMIAALKANSNGYVQEKEFIDDLYFLKKNGNQSVHSGKIKKDAMTALECLKRSFEVAINYSVYNQGASPNVLKLNYDIELLLTANKSKKSLKDKYEEEKIKQQQKATTNKKSEISQKQRKVFKTKEIPIFWKFTAIMTVISVLFVIFLVINIAIKLR